MNAAEDNRNAVTRLLSEASGGNREALNQLFPLVYDELRKIGRDRLRAERASHTLNATALVHEAYLTLVQQDRVEWQSRTHFFAVASTAMRRILISYARARLSQKRGDGADHVSLEDVAEGVAESLFTEEAASSLLAVDEALEQLASFNPRGAEVVEYRFFGGLAHKEIANVTGVSEVTVRRRWSAARAWLRTQLSDSELGRSDMLIASGGD